MEHFSAGEQLTSSVKPEEKFEYFGYRLSRPVICTLSFRDFITQKDQTARVAPIKGGEGQKFTQEGVLKVPRGFDPFACIRFRKSKVSYFTATLEDFNRVLQKARIKVFFRGFPLGTPTEEIRKFFSQFGRVEYLYLMASSKSGAVQTFIQGYFIYSSNEEAEFFLSQKKFHVFRGSRICCQVYIGNKKKKRNQENKMSNTEGSPFEDSASVAHSASILDPSSKGKKRFGGIGDHPNKAKMEVAQVTHDSLLKINPEIKYRRPYLRNLDLVKINSKEQNNIRFNICQRSPRHVSNRSII